MTDTLHSERAFVALIFPPGSPFPTVHDQWWRMQDGSLFARYTRAELAEALRIADGLTHRMPKAQPYLIPQETTL